MGFKRIIIFLSFSGALIGFIIFSIGSIEGIISNNKINNYKQLLVTLPKTDVDFLALSKDNQNQLLTEIQKSIKLLKNNTQWKSPLFGGLLFGSLWFILLWIIFYIARWIIQGFLKDHY